jgi:hypothetical protein
MTVITKIYNKEQRYTMVDVFSSFEKAKAFTDEFIAKVAQKDGANFNIKWDIQTELKEVDAPDYPFLKTKTYAVMRKVKGKQSTYDNPFNGNLYDTEDEAKKVADEANNAYKLMGLIPPYNDVISEYFAVEITVDKAGWWAVNEQYHLA